MLARWIPATFDFVHNVVYRGTAEPSVSIPRVVAARGSVQAKKTSQTVQSQFPLKNGESVALKILVGHSVDGDHDCTS